MVNKIFISYRADLEGEQYKRLLVAWSQNDTNFPEIKFHDTSIGTTINSENAAYIKSVIIERIKKSDAVLCLVGENTSSSEWVNWEIEKAFTLNKPIYAIKIQKSYTPPISLYGKNVKWAYSVTKENVINLLKL